MKLIGRPILPLMASARGAALWQPSSANTQSDSQILKVTCHVTVDSTVERLLTSTFLPAAEHAGL